MKEIICSVWHLPGREDIYEFPESIELYHIVSFWQGLLSRGMGDNPSTSWHGGMAHVIIPPSPTTFSYGENLEEACVKIQQI